MTVPENETGLVYNCPILGGSCDRVGSGEGSDERLFDSKRKLAMVYYVRMTVLVAPVVIIPLFHCSSKL